MAIERDVRFSVEHDEAFPLGLVLVGEVGPDNEFQENRNAPARQKIDPMTGKRVWKATVTDPHEQKAKRASFDVLFLADVQPVPATSEVLPGMRPIELEGLTAQPKVAGNGEFKYLSFVFRATGIKQAGAAGKPANRTAAGPASDAGKAA
jgi:hypothetical protein